MRIARSNGTSIMPSLSRGLTRRQRYVQLALIFAFWTLMAVFAISHVVVDHPERGPSEWLGKLARYYLWALLTPGIFWVSRRLQIGRSRWLRRVLLHLSIGVLVASFYGGIYHYLHGLLENDAARQMSLPLYWWQELQLGFIGHFFEYLTILGAGIALDYYRRYRARRRQMDRLHMQLSKARLNALRLQINPHFLFNALNTVSMLTARDPKVARTVIARLSKLLRHVLELSEEEEVPFEQELQFINDYLGIMHLRFGDRLEVRQDIAPGLREARVPPLILQPLVENAIKHAVTRTEGVSQLVIRAKRRDDELWISVRDDGPGLKDSPGNGMGVGLTNTRERLQQLYQGAADLSLHELPEGGTEATVALPYHTTCDFHLATDPA